MEKDTVPYSLRDFLWDGGRFLGGLVNAICEAILLICAMVGGVYLAVAVAADHTTLPNEVASVFQFATRAATLLGVVLLLAVYVVRAGLGVKIMPVHVPDRWRSARSVWPR